MPKQFNEEELEALVAAIENAPDGINAVTLREALPFEGSDKALLRRLNRLITQSRIRKEGRGRGTLYFPIMAGRHGEIRMPEYLTLEGKQVWISLSRPVSGARRWDINRNSCMGINPTGPGICRSLSGRN